MVFQSGLHFVNVFPNCRQWFVVGPEGVGRMEGRQGGDAKGALPPLPPFRGHTEPCVKECTGGHVAHAEDERRMYDLNLPEQPASALLYLGGAWRSSASIVGGTPFHHVRDPDMIALQCCF